MNILILTDRGVNKDNAAIPALLAVAGLHHHLIREGTRTRVGLVLESGEPREVHHFSALIGYGCGAINPYLAFETLDDMIRQGLLEGVDHKTACKNYVKAATKGVIKVASKIGISTIQSYRGAQIFEASASTRRWWTNISPGPPRASKAPASKSSRRKCSMRHSHAFPDRQVNGHALDVGGEYQWRKEGEAHLFSPQDDPHAAEGRAHRQLRDLQAILHAGERADEEDFTLRGLLDFKKRDADSDRGSRVGRGDPEALQDRRDELRLDLAGGARSLAIAMNRIGGKSNTGEGGEDPARYTWTNERGDSKNSAIKQVASGRFGVTSLYLARPGNCRSRWRRARSPAKAASFPAPRSIRGSPRCGTRLPASASSRRRRTTTSTRSKTSRS